MKYFKCMKLIYALSIAIVLSSCGSSGLDGTYTGKTGFEEMTVAFQSNGKVTMKTEGHTLISD